MLRDRCPATWYWWRHLVDLRAGDFTVVTPDLRGFGYSARHASGYDADTISKADLTAFERP
jgi:pimeloyl-ACP methyl ester carboxylesterase